MPLRPTVIAFDVVETLFSLEPVGVALAPLDVDLDHFFARLLRDAFAFAAADDFRPFPELARAVAIALAPAASDQQLQNVITAFARLPAHPDVTPALDRLASEGVRVVAFSNGGVEATKALLAANGLESRFERVLGVDGASRWKPSPGAYRYALAALDEPATSVALVAVHSWDIHGASRAGLTTGWCSRLEGRYPATFDPPDVTGPDLGTVIGALLQLPASCPPQV